METEEAIFENENNSNLESESNRGQLAEDDAESNTPYQDAIFSQNDFSTAENREEEPIDYETLVNETDLSSQIDSNANKEAIVTSTTSYNHEGLLHEMNYDSTETPDPFNINNVEHEFLNYESDRKYLETTDTVAISEQSENFDNQKTGEEQQSEFVVSNDIEMGEVGVLPENKTDISIKVPSNESVIDASCDLFSESVDINPIANLVDYEDLNMEEEPQDEKSIYESFPEKKSESLPSSLSIEEMENKAELQSSKPQQVSETTEDHSILANETNDSFKADMQIPEMNLDSNSENFENVKASESGVFNSELSEEETFKDLVVSQPDQSTSEKDLDFGISSQGSSDNFNSSKAEVGNECFENSLSDSEADNVKEIPETGETENPTEINDNFSQEGISIENSVQIHEACAENSTAVDNTEVAKELSNINIDSVDSQLKNIEDNFTENSDSWLEDSEHVNKNILESVSTDDPKKIEFMQDFESSDKVNVQLTQEIEAFEKTSLDNASLTNKQVKNTTDNNEPDLSLSFSASENIDTKDTILNCEETILKDFPNDDSHIIPNNTSTQDQSFNMELPERESSDTQTSDQLSEEKAEKSALVLQEATATNEISSEVIEAEMLLPEDNTENELLQNTHGENANFNDSNERESFLNEDGKSDLDINLNDHPENELDQSRNEIEENELDQSRNEIEENELDQSRNKMKENELDQNKNENEENILGQSEHEKENELGQSKNEEKNELDQSKNEVEENDLDQSKNAEEHELDQSKNEVEENELDQRKNAEEHELDQSKNEVEENELDQSKNEAEEHELDIQSKNAEEHELDQSKNKNEENDLIQSENEEEKNKLNISKYDEKDCEIDKDKESELEIEKDNEIDKGEIKEKENELDESKYGTENNEHDKCKNSSSSALVEGTPLENRQEEPMDTEDYTQSVDEPLIDAPNIKKEPEKLVSFPQNNSRTSLSEIENCPNVKKEVPDCDDVVLIDDIGEELPVNKMDPEESATSASNISEASVKKEKAEESSAVNTKSKPKNKSQICIVCQKICRCKYNIVRNGDIKHLCDDACFKLFRANPGSYLKVKEGSKDSEANKKQPSKNKQSVSSSNKLMLMEASSSYKTCTICQIMNVNKSSAFCNWKGLDFCGENCLGKFQSGLSSICANCQVSISLEARAAFCLKIGNDVKTFCKQRCYNDYKRNVRLCSLCQTDLSTIPSVLTAVVGSDSKFREFCSQACLDRMEEQVKTLEILENEKSSKNVNSKANCSVCKKNTSVKHNLRFEGNVYKLCSSPCLSAFEYTNKIGVNKCNSCGTICTTEEANAHFVQYEGHMKRFCSDKCLSVFRGSNRKIVPCSWCSSKKLNFDMIERLGDDNKYQLFCSLTCLSLFRVNLQAKSNQAIACDFCKKVAPAQYHLTMSDASVRNFCCYPCVSAFQALFTQTPKSARQQAAQANKMTPPSSRGKSKPRAGSRAGKQGFGGHVVPSTSPVPVISSVMSLAVQKDPKKNILTSPQPAPAPAPAPLPKLQHIKAGQMVPSGDGKNQVIVKQPPPKQMKNKGNLTRPTTTTKATSCRPHSQNKEIQTDKIPPKRIAIPIPVPVYIPMPTVMYQAPTPVILPIPIPIPVPMFIPTTRKSANGILKAIKEITERMPADPLEAEILMMAEAVAVDKKAGDSDSDSENDAQDFEPQAEVVPTPVKQEESAVITKRKEGGGEEDMIQMALRMAEEMSNPIEDLETSVEPVAVNAEPPQSQHAIGMNQFQQQPQDEDYVPTGRGRGKRQSTRGRPTGGRAKRQKMDKMEYNEPKPEPAPTPVPQITEPPADTNYRLKFTYGVNAWRYWVISKNQTLEKTKQNAGIHKMRLFPTDILKCTTDELNMTLCMFVKEVRKPNGDEYSPDSVYYLCLGIQQYLYENGRIDNIFTDIYFEKYTDILHDVIKTLKPKVNTQGQMLCRIEEEHLWESKQLGAHSPFVLLNTLIYFHTKHFILKTAEEHMSLSFAQILKHWKKGIPMKPGQAAGAKNVSLRFYCLANGKKDGVHRRGKEGVPVYEVTENFDNPLRCPVKLYEFFLSKCPESIKNRNDIFYPVPERSCVPDSPVWYSTQTLTRHTMDKMLTRILLVREIQEAHLHAQPMYLHSL